jgi:hypothetical protein
MHYKNGREAKIGDTIVAKEWNGVCHTEVVVAATADSESCNLYTIPIPQNTNCRTASEVLHAEDAIKGL